MVLDVHVLLITLRDMIKGNESVLVIGFIS